MSRESIDFKYFVTHILWKSNWFQAKRGYSVVFKSSKAGKCEGNPFLSLSLKSQWTLYLHGKKRKQSAPRYRPLS